MANLCQEVAINIVSQIIKVLPYLEVNVQDQLKIKNIIEDNLNNYEIKSICTDLVTSDFKEKAANYLACKRLEGISDATLYNYKLVLLKMNDYFNKPVSMITTSDLRMFIVKEYGNNKQNSVNTIISKIKTFFVWLQDEGYIINNPSKNLKLIKEPYRRRKSIKNIDVEMMREKCVSIRQKALFEFLLSTGCRVSEVSNATIDKIDWNNNSISVIGKGNKERTVFFSTRAKMFLMNYINSRTDNNIISNYLFISSKKPFDRLSQRSVEREIKKISQNSDIEYSVFPHLFRHTYATVGVNQNISLPVLQQLMGHSSPNTTQVYYDLDENSLKTEYKKISL